MDAFPIRHDPQIHSIPWAVIVPHEQQALINHRKPLAELAERGGLTPCEALAVIEGRPWERMSYSAARQRLTDYVRGAGCPEPHTFADAARVLEWMRDGQIEVTRGAFDAVLRVLDNERSR